jgi:hypothetical protein
MNELKSSDVEDVRIAIVNGLKGCDAGDSAGGHGGLSASASARLRCPSDPLKDRKAVGAALEKIYKGKDADTGKAARGASPMVRWDKNVRVIFNSGEAIARR